MAVFVLDKHKKPLMPCSEARASSLLKRGRARVHKLHPFTIRIVDRLVENSVVDGVQVKIDPGSKETGIAVVRTDDEGTHPLGFYSLVHRGDQIHKKMQQRANYRRRRRSANLRYRAPRFQNRKRREGSLPPSLQHRVDTTVSWVKRFTKLAPVTGISMELVRFDTQKLQNPEISGVEYQQGTLFGYEVREYLLLKWEYTCAYCGKKNVSFEVDHINPKARGGSNRISNLTLACHECNQKKGDKPIEVFLKDKPEVLRKIQEQCKTPLKDAAAVNATRWSLYNQLKKFGLPIETGTGAQTKWNRIRLNIPKEHWLDAVCVGTVSNVSGINKPVLRIQCCGRGSHQRTRVDSHGFPRGFCMRTKRVHGFATGDIVFAQIPKGKNQGEYIGRVSVRQSGSFDLKTANGKIGSISWKYCRLLAKNDGYGYSYDNLKSEKNEQC